MTKQNALLELTQLLEKQKKNSILENVTIELLSKSSHVYLLGPTSFLGLSFSVPIAKELMAMGKSVILVDDTISVAPIEISSCSVITTLQFSTCASLGSIAVNMGNTIVASGLFKFLSSHAGIKCLDIISVLDAFNLPVIYQTATTMRSATFDRLEDYQSFAEQLDDAFSIRTLSAFLEMRLTVNRDAIVPVLCSLEDEYFSPYSAGKDVTFKMGQEEVFCDIGAHVGTTIRRFLTATQWKYTAIHAFEPDKGSYSALRQGLFEQLPNFHAKNIALSDTSQVLSFSETGTMGSRLDGAGNVKIHTSTLDNEMEHATFIKMDVEGHETSIIRGAQRLISHSKPRLAITGYHFANDLLEIAKLLKDIEPRYRLRLRHHSYYYFDTILYADLAV